MFSMKNAWQHLVALAASTSLLAAPASGDNVFTANLGDNTISHIVTKGPGGATIPLTCQPFDLQLASSGIGYASCFNANSVGVFNTTTNNVTATVGGIASPQKMAIGLTETRLVVANGTFAAPHVTILDTTTNAVVDTIDLTSFGANTAYTVSCFRTLLAIGNSTGHTFLYDISTTPATFVREYASGVVGIAGIKHVAFTPDGTKLYVVVNQSVSVIDENNVSQTGNVLVLRVPGFAVKSVLNLGSNELQYAQAVDGSYMYLTGFDGLVYAVDANADALVNTLAIGTVGTSQAEGIAATSLSQPAMLLSGLLPADALLVIYTDL